MATSSQSVVIISCFRTKRYNFAREMQRSHLSLELLDDMAQSARRVLRFGHGTRRVQSEGAANVPLFSHNQYV
jgi:hypothetical protein